MRHSERGVALVEFALRLPFLMLMLLGLVEIGRSGATNAGDSSGIHDEVMADGQNTIANLTESANTVCACWNNTTRTETPSTPTVAACGQTCTTGQRVGYVPDISLSRFDREFFGHRRVYNAGCEQMRRGERGTGMVEFCLICVMLLLLIAGILEFGRALYTYHTVSNAARLGSRWAMLRGSACTAPLDHCNASSSDARTYVRSQVVALIDTSQLSVDATWPGNGAGCSSGSNAPGCPVHVVVQYPFTFAIPMAGTGLNIASSSEMVISQ